MSQDTKSKEKSREVAKVLVIEMLLNILVAATKGAYGLWAGSLVIAADAIHSLTDAAANILGLIVTRFSSAPPDSNHPYGHHKVEIIAAACIGVAIGVAAVNFGWNAISALIYGREPPAQSIIGFVVLGLTLVINVFVAWWEARKAKQLGSAYLAADAAHTASDLIVTMGVIGSYAASYAGVVWADAVGALFVIAVIGRVAWMVLSSNLSILVDAAVLDGERVKSIAMTVAGVRGVHRIRSRGSTGEIWIDMHIQLDSTMSLQRAHQIAHKVEDALRASIAEISDVTVHMEPDDNHDEPL